MPLQFYKPQRIGDVTYEQVGHTDPGTLANNSLRERLKMFNAEQSAYEPTRQKTYDLYNRYLDDIPGLEGQNLSSIDTSTQRGLTDAIRRSTAQLAGTSRFGTKQATGQYGSIAQGFGQAMGQANLAARNQALNQVSAAQRGLAALESADQARRNEFGSILQGGLSNAMATQIQPGPEEPSFLQQALPVLGTAAGAYFGGPLGAMVGGQIGGLAGGQGGKQQEMSPLAMAIMASSYANKGGGSPGGGVAPTGLGMNPDQYADSLDPYATQASPGYSAAFGQDYTNNLMNSGYGSDAAYRNAMMGDPYGIGSNQQFQQLGYQQFDPSLMQNWGGYY